MNGQGKTSSVKDNEHSRLGRAEAGRIVVSSKSKDDIDQRMCSTDANSF